MKIFAKRKRKSTASSGTDGITTFASDPVVEELLKLDPSQWNAKQKRMVKRYQDRKEEHAAATVGEESEKPKVESTDCATPALGSDVTPSEPTNNKNAVEGNAVDESESDEEDSGSGSDGSSDSESESDDEKKMNETEEMKDAAVIESAGAATTPSPKEPEVDHPNNNDQSQNSNDGKEAAVLQLLEGLNSKWKRTLSRKLQRGGQAVLEEVRKEAQEILATTQAESSSSSNNGKKRNHEEGAASSNNSVPDMESSTGSKAKKSKKEADWSSLPPEERLRREEQRLKQKEAAERRARGEESKGPHKHALNSERRRANRRKPKWNKKSAISAPNEHDTSGYQHRRTTGQGEATY